MDLGILGWGDSGWGDEFARGALMTFLVALCAFVLGLMFGTLFAAFKLSQSRVLKLIGDVYTTVLRGIPELLVIYLVFFGGGTLLAKIASSLFGYDGYIDLPVFGIGALCIGLSAGAYSTEVIRGAVQAIPKGQIEAAHAIGMNGWLRFWRVLVPQAARYALPGLGNDPKGSHLEGVHRHLSFRPVLFHAFSCCGVQRRRQLQVQGGGPAQLLAQSLP